MGKKSDILNDVADATAKANHIALDNVRAIHQNFACVRDEQPVDQSKRCGFPGTTPTKQNQSLTALRCKI
jgi:hypothetical protein